LGTLGSVDAEGKENAMGPSRRRFLRLARGATVLPVLSRTAWAQAYPTRPVRLIVGFPAGTSADILARLMGQWLSERLGQPFVIENRPGASSNIATETVVKAPADGHTLLWVTSANSISATLYDNLNFAFLRDIDPVAGVSRDPLVMLVNPSFPANSVSEFITYTKANPGKINMASGGNGTVFHVAGEQFKMMAGLDMIHIPYRGDAPALIDLIGGQVQVMFDLVAGSIEYIKAGRLRALAVTTTNRWEGLPDVPTVGEFLPGFEASALAGVGVPTHTSVEIVDRLNKEINAGLADPRMRARFVELRTTALLGSARDFGKILAQDTQRWGKVVKAANIKAD
jgi:tripartite-type tricarboxylate transporter receptor subunit TctC